MEKVIIVIVWKSCSEFELMEFFFLQVTQERSQQLLRPGLRGARRADERVQRCARTDVAQLFSELATAQ